MEAQKCPVCDGSGEVRKRTTDVLGNKRFRRYVGLGDAWYDCHGCCGQGWVAVGPCFAGEPVVYPNTAHQ